MDRVHFITTRGKGEHERLVALPHDMPQLQRFIEENGVVYVLVDPFMAFLDDATDANKEQEVRRCLYALKQTAEATQAAILCIRHLNKRVGTDAMNRGGGSIGIGAACRCWLTAGKHPENPDVMVLAPNRITAVRAPQAIEYTIASAAVAGTDDKGNAVTIPTATVTWGDLSTVTADQLVGFGGSKAGSKTIAANELILLTLAGRGPLTAADLESAVLAHDIKQHTFENARAELQRQGEIVSGRSGFGDKGKVCWRLKSQKFPREEAGKAHTPRSAHQ
jgi:hypothetical protein